MNSICFTGVLALCCGCVFGDTAPVPVADGEEIVLRDFGGVVSVLRPGDDYGVMLVNAGKGEEKPEMLVVVTRRHPAEVYHVRSFKELESVLRLFPAGALFYEYDRCLTPAAYGLPEGTWRKVAKVIRKCGHRFDDGEDARSGPRITCTCPK